MKVVIGLVGKPLAGKETVGNILMKLAVNKCGYKTDCDYASRQRFRDVLEETLKIWNIEVNRDNLQKLSQVMVTENAFGKNALSGAIYNRLTRDKVDIVIADGVRWLADEEMIRSIPENRGIILYVVADFETRFNRAKTRRREGEGEMSVEKFRQQDSVKTEIFIEDIGGRADWAINNSEGVSLAELEEKAKEFFVKKVIPLL